MKIGDMLHKIGNLPYLTLDVDCTLEEASKKIADAGHLRTIYVVSRMGHLQGILSLGELIRTLITAGHKPHFHARSLLERITAKKVADIMDKYVVYSRKEDDPNSVLVRMIDNHIKEIPVVDENKKIIANIGIIDLWKLIENRRKLSG